MVDKAKKIIVTGGAGFIGSNLVDALVSAGYEVHVIDNLFSGKAKNVHPKAILHVLDIRDKEKLFPIFENAKYVLEVSAGFSDKNNLKIGDSIKFIY